MASNQELTGAVFIGDETYEWEGRIEFQTAKARLVQSTIGAKVWVPKGQTFDLIRIGTDDDGPFLFHTSEWWTKKAKGQAVE